MRTVHVIVNGLVQGVAFREYTRRQAVSMGLSGWVKNRSDGSVEAMVHGPADRVETMLQWLQHGSPRARVDSLQLEESNETASTSTFDIRF